MRMTCHPIDPMKVAYICVDEQIDSDIRGRLYHMSLSQPICFSSVLALVCRAEELYEQCASPQSYYSPRSFTDATRLRLGFPKKKEAYNMVDAEEFRTLKGDKGTFVVQVLFRQHGTWQGTITWTEQKKTQRFRSALEMIRLMDEALSCTTENDNLTWSHKQPIDDRSGKYDEAHM